MRKGKLGVAFVFYAAAAFVLAYFGQTTVLALLTGVVLIIEKDEWASKMCLQAVGLAGIQWIISEAFSLLYKPMSWISQFITDYESAFYDVEKVINKILYFAREAVDIAILVFAITAILEVIKEKDAKIPVASDFANWAVGLGKGKKCPKCGAVVTGKFCDKCGEKLD